MVILCLYMRNWDGKLVDSYSQICVYLDLGGMLILDSGILLALCLSCGYNLKVCALVPPFTRVQATTVDKALTSGCVVKLGRKQLCPMMYTGVLIIF